MVMICSLVMVVAVGPVAGAASATGRGTDSSPRAQSCADGGPCVIGDVGPGQGIVFYDAGSPQPWGRYLEAAPRGWNGKGRDPAAQWCDKAHSYSGSQIKGARGLLVGTGAKNTAAMVAACKTGAGVLAHAYTGGGRTDWFLPSQGELIALYQQKGIVGGLLGGGHWSSSQADSGFDWMQDFADGMKINSHTYNRYYVRPVRSF